LYVSVEPWRLVEWVEKGESEPNMKRDLALHMGQKYDENRRLLDKLALVHGGATVSLVIEVAAFMIDLWSK
jgi:hypothetical protein